MADEPSPGYYPWFLLSQPAPFPERLIGASAEYFPTHTLDDWTAISGAIEDEAVARYLATFTPDTIAAMCSDYRAAFHLDRPQEAEDRAAVRKIDCPVLVHWGSEDMADSPLPVWRAWAGDVRGGPLPSGHFLPEEAPDELVASLRGLLSISCARGGAAGGVPARVQGRGDGRQAHGRVRRRPASGAGRRTAGGARRPRAAAPSAGAPARPRRRREWSA